MICSDWLINTVAFGLQLTIINLVQLNYSNAEFTSKCSVNNCSAVLIETLLAVAIMTATAGFAFRRFELLSRRDSLFNITAIAQMEQANVLDALPDAIIIANSKQSSYANFEAWDLLNCKTERKQITNPKEFAETVCTDRETGAEVTLTNQLSSLLKTVDPRLASVEDSKVLKTLISMATDKSKLIQLHHLDTSSDDEEILAAMSPEELELARAQRNVRKLAELAASTRK